MKIKLIACFIIIGVIFIGLLSTFTLERIKGNEVGVMETYSSGVLPKPLSPRMYWRNRFTTKIYHYDMSSQVFVMNDVPSHNGEKGKGRENDPYLVQSSDQQDMYINLNLRWRKEPSKIIELHTNYHAYIGNDDDDILEERLIRPAVMRIVKNKATNMKAMEAYSGEGLIRLQVEIEKQLSDPNEDVSKQGIIVDNFVIEKITLDPNYTAEIKARQIAQQKKLRADEETKAAEAEALKAKAEAGADLNRKVVEADRDKQVALLLASQKAESQVIAANAQAKQITIDAIAQKEAAEARASAIKALGEAEAAAQKLKFAAYSAPGAEIYAQIQIAQSLGSSLSGIQGYLPQGMNVNLLGDNFLNMVHSALNPINRQVVPVNTTQPDKK